MGCNLGRQGLNAWLIGQVSYFKRFQAFEGGTVDFMDIKNVMEPLNPQGIKQVCCKYTKLFSSIFSLLILRLSSIIPWFICFLQIDYYCRLDCLQKNKFKQEHESFETMENVNRLLLENVLPAHVAAHFIGDKLNEV